ncbi:MAG TPA: SRPBCC family protein [Solirubrobacteraceae bacterium]|nr:SRPBCC family protein [Solirubrobacteraceae bacterium]
MSLVIASIDIDAPRQEVWDHIMDPDKMRSWVTIVQRIDSIDPGPIRTGFQMSQTLYLRGVHFKVRWTLEELSAPRFARWEGKGPARSTAITENRLTERDGRTHFDYRNEFRTPFGPLGAAASKVIVGGIPEKEANASLHRLKAILERA